MSCWNQCDQMSFFSLLLICLVSPTILWMLSVVLALISYSLLGWMSWYDSKQRKKLLILNWNFNLNCKLTFAKLIPRFEHLYNALLGWKNQISVNILCLSFCSQLQHSFYSVSPTQFEICRFPVFECWSKTGARVEWKKCWNFKRANECVFFLFCFVLFFLLLHPYCRFFSLVGHPLFRDLHTQLRVQLKVFSFEINFKKFFWKFQHLIAL